MNQRNITHTVGRACSWSPSTAQKIWDYLDFSRAVEAMIMSTPAASLSGFRNGVVGVKSSRFEEIERPCWVSCD
jgi:hypothetical protein